MAETKSRPSLCVGACMALAAGVVLALSCSVSAQTTSPATASSAPTSSAQAPPAGTAATSVRRRQRRRYAARPVVPSTAPIQQQTVGLSPEQRRRDAQILASQQAQSSETARQQAIVTGKVIKERQAQQDEPRIQDAPGPGSQPIPGNPAVSTSATNNPSSIQDAPGPAQTLNPQPATPATTPAPQK